MTSKVSPKVASKPLPGKSHGTLIITRALVCEMQVMETFQRHETQPSAERINSCVAVLEDIVPHLGPYRDVMNLIKNEVIASIYTKNVYTSGRHAHDVENVTFFDILARISRLKQDENLKKEEIINELTEKNRMNESDLNVVHRKNVMLKQDLVHKESKLTELEIKVMDLEKLKTLFEEEKKQIMKRARDNEAVMNQRLLILEEELRDCRQTLSKMQIEEKEADLVEEDTNNVNQSDLNLPEAAVDLFTNTLQLHRIHDQSIKITNELMDEYEKKLSETPKSDNPLDELERTSIKENYELKISEIMTESGTLSGTLREYRKKIAIYPEIRERHAFQFLFSAEDSETEDGNDALSETMLKIWKSFYARYKIRRPFCPRKLSFQSLLLIFQNFYNEMWSSEYKFDEENNLVSYERKPSFEERFYQYFEQAHIYKNVAIKNVHDIITSAGKYETKMFVNLFLRHLSNEYQCIWKYIHLVRNLTEKWNSFGLEEFKEFASLLWSKQMENYEELELEMVSFSQNKISKETIEMFVCQMIFKDKEPNIQLYTKVLEDTGKSRLLLSEFIAIVEDHFPQITEDMVKREFIASSKSPESFNAESVTVGIHRLSHVMAFFNAFLLFKNGWSLHL